MERTSVGSCALALNDPTPHHAAQRNRKVGQGNGKGKAPGVFSGKGGSCFPGLQCRSLLSLGRRLPCGERVGFVHELLLVSLLRCSESLLETVCLLLTRTFYRVRDVSTESPFLMNKNPVHLSSCCPPCCCLETKQNTLLYLEPRLCPYKVNL